MKSFVTSTRKRKRTASPAVFLGATVIVLGFALTNISSTSKMISSIYIPTKTGIGSGSGVETVEAKSNTPLPKKDKENDEKTSSCPSVIRTKTGLFDKATSNSPLKDRFRNTVLLVSSNYAYYNMLQNWEFLAGEHHLKWAVLALDEKLYRELGPERAAPSHDTFSVSGAQPFHGEHFKELSCNKIRMAMEIATTCQVNVVFSDSDNIFFKNPFEHDLGKMILSNRYDYIYQAESVAEFPRQHKCMKGDPDKGNNTGFYYFNYRSKFYNRVGQAALISCNNDPKIQHDQMAFWQEFNRIKNEEASNPTTHMHHCGSAAGENEDDSDWIAKVLESPLSWKDDNGDEKKNDESESEPSFHWCCMDPYYHPIGKNTPPSNKDPVTFHANFVNGFKRKTKRLRRARADKYGWDPKRLSGDVGDGILED